MRKLEKLKVGKSREWYKFVRTEIIIIMETVYHLRIKDESAARIIEELIHSDAVEDLDVSSGFTLTDAQKAAVDTEIEKITTDSNYLVEWNSVKERFKKS